MRLYYDPNSTSSRIVSFLMFDHELPIEEGFVRLDAAEQYAPAFLAINPNGLVPVLVDGEVILRESSAILRYLDARFGLGLYPQELVARLKVDEAISWFQGHFHLYHCALLSYTYVLPHLQAMETHTLEQVRKLGAAGSQRFLKVLDQHMLAGQAYVAGDQLTLADYVGITYVMLGEFANIDLTAYPNIVRWINRLKARPGFAPAYAAFNGALQAFRPVTMRAV